MYYMIERIDRTLHTRNRDVANAISYDELVKKISLANVLHSESSIKLVDEWIEEYDLKKEVNKVEVKKN